MLQTFIDFFTQVAAQWGLLIVFVVTFLETSVMLGLLVPGETTVLLAGALAARGVMDIWALIAVVCVAGLIGDNVGYFLGRRLGRDFVLRHGHVFRVREHHFDRAERYFDRRGGITILFGRWIGFFRSLAPFVAGSAHMSYPRFAVYDFFGVVSWGVASCLLGYLFGASYGLIDQWLGRLSLFALATVVAFVLLWLFGRYLSRHRAALEGLTGIVTDRVLEWSPIRSFRHRFAPQIAWVFARFSPRRAYGLGLTIGLLIALGFGYLFGLMTDVVLDRGRFLGIDGWVADIVEENRVPWVTSLMKVVTQFGGAVFLLAATAVIVGVLVGRRKRWEALTLLTAAAGALLAALVLQGLVQRPRPTAPEPLIDVGGYGFPSAHATGAMAFYVTVAVLATGWVRSWETRVYLLVSALAVALVIGFSRVYLGVHYTTDVLAGFALGVGWLTLCVTAATVLSRASSPAEEGAEPAGPAPGHAGEADHPVSR